MQELDLYAHGFLTFYEIFGWNYFEVLDKRYLEINLKYNPFIQVRQNMVSVWISRWTKEFRKSEHYLEKINTNLESNHFGRFSLLSISKALYLITAGEKNTEERICNTSRSLWQKKNIIPVLLKSIKIIQETIYSLTIAC